MGRYRACPRSINVIWSCLLARYRLHICTCACVLRPDGRRPTYAGSRMGAPPHAPRSGVPRPLLPLGCSLWSHRATVVAALAHRLSGALPPPHFLSADAVRVSPCKGTLRSRGHMARGTDSAFIIGGSYLFAYAHSRASYHYSTIRALRGLCLHSLRESEPPHHVPALTSCTFAGTAAPLSRFAHSFLPCVSHEKPPRPTGGSLGMRSRAPAFRVTLA